jgi:hypothetical protein
MNKQQKKEYLDAVKAIDPMALPDVLRSQFTYVDAATDGHRSWKYYDASPEIRETVDGYCMNILQHLNEAGKEKGRGQVNDAPKSARKTRIKPDPGTKDAPPATQVKLVRDIGVELGLITRFLGLHGKPRKYKQVLGTLKAVQRAIQKGHVRKTNSPTPYNLWIAWIQHVLIKAVGHYSGKDPDEVKEVSFDPKKIAELSAIRKSFDVLPSVRLGLRFLQIEGRQPTEAEAARLILAIEKAELAGKIKEDDPNIDFINAAKSAISDFGHRKTSIISVNKATLEGFAGTVLGCACMEGGKGKPTAARRPGAGLGYIIPPPRGGAVEIGSDALSDLQDDGLHFTGRWRGLFNSPTSGFSAMIYGMPKSGKSTLSIDFAGYLARNFGRVLYASIEEGARGTIAERIKRLDAAHPSLIVSNHLPADLSSYRFVFVDSVSRGRMDIDQLRDMIRQWPGIGFIFIFHVTKDGMPRGSAEFQHEVDVIVEVKDGHAEAVGRFGPGSAEVRFG